ERPCLPEMREQQQGDLKEQPNQSPTRAERMPSDWFSDQGRNLTRGSSLVIFHQVKEKESLHSL
ncbi:hypothetical protein Bpfe_031052, partial [Biomphalaria pfeifferi]